MADRLVFPYIINANYAHDSIARPFLPITLSYRSIEMSAQGLIDSGADLNVVPYSVGIELGATWDDHQPYHGLSGLTETLESRRMLLDISVGSWPSKRMGFAWTKTDDLPVILGQVSFFTHFAVCFMRARGVFEVEIQQSSDIGT